MRRVVRFALVILSLALVPGLAACGDSGGGAEPAADTQTPADTGDTAGGQEIVFCAWSCDRLECGNDGCGNVCGTCEDGNECVQGTCVPSCAPACEGRTCGDDGCGGTCGDCGADEACAAGHCTAPCEPACGANECGDNGCGGTCGDCPVGEQCFGGTCMADCTPSCTGRTCGSDGCGGSCGSCGADENCANGQCVAACTPDCSTRTCGDNGCGGMCGTCPVGEFCVAGACEPTCTADCAGKVCGDDGCGGSCGACAAGEACLAGACSSTCSPDCAGKVCGADGCGGTCGTCGAGESCGNGACAPVCTPDCGGKVCGDNGCGGSCGSCAAGASCVDGACIDACQPACDGRACGPDGCGATCGTCGAGEACTDGDCALICTPSCGDAVCGDNGCGGSCGSCDSALVCAEGECVPPNAVVDWCRFQWPREATVEVGKPLTVYARFFEPGVTDRTGAVDPDAGLMIEAGVVADGAQPGAEPVTAWVAAMPNAEWNDAPEPGNDEYMALLVAPATPGTYDLTFRATVDGGVHWTWCDLPTAAGDGSGDGYQPANAASLAAMCVPDCGDRVCGADGCGGTCGACEAGESCEEGACVGGANPVDWCRLQWPPDATVEPGATFTAYVRIYEAGVTDRSVATDVDPAVLVEGGIGPDGAAPTDDDWIGWSAAVANADWNGETAGERDNDEYQLDFAAPGVAGSYDYAFRASADGGVSWTHCDLDDSDNGYQEASAGALTVAVVCVPACEDRACGDDGCGGSCGECADGADCVDGQCVVPCVPACDGRDCGDDGCGDSCGDCAGDESCADGQCVADCVPACTDRACGDDGCGGVCGECSFGLVCQDGQCADLPAFGWCRYQWPTSQTAAAGSTFTAYVHVYVSGVTDRTSGTDTSARLNVAHVVLNDGDDPATGGGTFGWTVASANEGWSDAGEPNNDEYQVEVPVPATAGTYDMAFSVTLDGGRTMYCDTNAGMGSDGSEDGYQPANAATLVVE